MRATVCISVLLLLTAAPTVAKQGEVPPWMRLTLNAPGVPRDLHPEADDQGPPADVKERLFYSTGANFTGVGANWGDCEPQRPRDLAHRKFDFSKLEEEIRGKPERMWLKVHLHLGCKWAEEIKEKNEDLWWELAEGFMTEAAKFARKTSPKAVYYWTPGNEPSLTMKPDWAFTHMAPIKHYYKAVKAASPDNQVMVGALVVGRRGHVEALYAAGLKNNFDVLDIHAYDDTKGKTYVSISQIVESHQVLSEHGDGDKMIFLGEGWSCFPLPLSVDGREHERYEKGMGVSMETYSYAPEEIEHYRQTVLRGWRALTTPRPGHYDPRWTLGASYFTMNDFWGSMHWEERAIPHYDGDGNIEWWDLDGYYVPYAPFAMKPKYRPWGLVDADGKPKGDIIQNFPPYLPKIEIVADIDAPVIDGSPTVAAGEQYTVTVSVRNMEPDAISDCRFGMGMRNNHDVELKWRDQTGTPAPNMLHYNRAATRKLSLVVPPGAIGRRLETSAELNYTWEGKPYYYDAWLDFNVVAKASARLTRSVPVADRKAPAAFSVTLKNIQRRRFETELVAKPSKNLSIEPQRVRVGLEPNSEKTYDFKVRLAPGAPAGMYGFTILTGPAIPDIQSNVAFTDGAVSKPRPGVLINGSFEEIGIDTGFNGWTGTANNWQIGDALEDLRGSGERCWLTAWCGTKHLTTISQYVELPNPERAWERSFRVRAMFKGIGFREGDETNRNRETTCELHMDFRGKDNGGSTGKAKSETFRGTGAWREVVHEFGPIPKGTYGLRLKIELEDEEAEGWHLGYVDLVEMDVPR